MGASPQASASSSGNRASSLSFTLTIPAGVTQGVVLIGISVDDTSGRTVSSVTVGGAAATSVRHDGGSGSATWIYRCVTGPSTGAKTIAITLSGAVSGDLIAGATVFDGVDQTTPVGNSVGGTGTTAIPTLNVTSSTNDSAFDCVHANGNGSTIGVGGGQTQQWNVQGPRNRTRGGGSTEAGASSVAMSWTVTGSTLTSHSAVNVFGAAPSGDMSAEGDGTATGTATLEASGRMAAEADGLATSTATLSAFGAMSGKGDGVASSSATLSSLAPSGDMTAQSDGVASSSATLEASGSLAAAAAGVASSTSHIAGAGAMIASASGVASSTAQIAASGSLVARVDGIASSTSTLSSIGAGPVARGDGIAGGTATLSASGALLAKGDGLSSSTAIISASGAMIAISAGIASSTASLEASGALAAEGDGSAFGTATITGSTIHVPLFVSFSSLTVELWPYVGGSSVAASHSYDFSFTRRSLIAASALARQVNAAVEPAHSYNFGVEVA